MGSVLGALLGLTAWLAVNPAVVQYITQSRCRLLRLGLRKTHSIVMHRSSVQQGWVEGRAIRQGLIIRLTVLFRIGRVMKLQDNYTLSVPPAANIDEDRQESDGNVRLV